MTKEPAKKPAAKKAATKKITKRNADGRIPSLTIDAEQAFEILIRCDHSMSMRDFHKHLTEVEGFEISHSCIRKWCHQNQWMKKRDEVFGNGDNRVAEAFKRLIDAYSEITGESLLHGVQCIAMQTLKNKLENASLSDTMAVIKVLNSMSNPVPQSLENINESAGANVLEMFRKNGETPPETEARSDLGTFKDKVVTGGNAR